MLVEAFEEGKLNSISGHEVNEVLPELSVSTAIDYSELMTAVILADALEEITCPVCGQMTFGDAERRGEFMANHAALHDFEQAWGPIQAADEEEG